MEEIFILSAVRTAVGGFGGGLKDVAAAKLGEIVIREAVARAGVTADQVGHVVLGNVIPSTPADAYIARVAAVNAGLPVTTPALTVNRLCGSGLQAIVSAAQGMRLGEYEFAVAGGAENMSQSPFIVTESRFGKKMGDSTMLDALTRTLQDPFENFHMGVTAENVATEFGITREAQDALAVESHHRAARAAKEGRFREQIIPVEVRTRGVTTAFESDEHVRADATSDGMAKLRPVFIKDGSVTAGNASGINDGAAAVVLASGSAVARLGLKARTRILGWGHVGVEPRVMGLGPIHAVPIALERAGVALDHIDVIESNEAFAAQACAVAGRLGFDPAKTNINGSAIALGHPIGATGAILTVKAVHELERSGGRLGLITLCIGGGQGIAMVIERV